MTAPAVQAPPNGNAAPAANGAPPNGEGTGADPKLTSQAAGGGTQNTPGGTEPQVTEFDRRVSERIEREKASIAAQAIKDYEAEKAAATKDKTVSAAGDDFLKEAATNLKGIKIEVIGADGKPAFRTLTDEEIQAAVASPFNDKFRATARQIEAEALETELAEAALEALGADPEVRSAFAKLVQDPNGAPSKDLKSWLEAWAEAKAPQTRVYKDMRDAEYARGWDERHNAPAGSVSMQAARNSTGPITKERYLAMSLQERVDYGRQHPEEIKALQ